LTLRFLEKETEETEKGKQIRKKDKEITVIWMINEGRSV
jgi:hypothetical protein